MFILFLCLTIVVLAVGFASEHSKKSDVLGQLNHAINEHRDALLKVNQLVAEKVNALAKVTLEKTDLIATVTNQNSKLLEYHGDIQDLTDEIQRLHQQLEKLDEDRKSMVASMSNLITEKNALSDKLNAEAIVSIARTKKIAKKKSSKKKVK